jgi:hypothetical protein
MRVGATDLLPDWLAAEPERNWDVFVSGYARATPARAVATVIGGYNKLSTSANACSPARWICRLPLRAAGRRRSGVTTGSISAFFASDRLGLAVAHPAQDWSGYWSHRIMLRNPLAEWRETNFVEIMCPCVDTGFIARRLNDLPITFSTWGTDHALCHLARADGGGGHHRHHGDPPHRPIKTDGAFYRKLAGDGIGRKPSSARCLPRCRTTVATTGCSATTRAGPAGARGAAWRLVEKHKARILRFKGHHGRLEY